MFTEEKDINDFKYNNEVLDNVSNMDLFMYFVYYLIELKKV